MQAKKAGDLGSVRALTFDVQGTCTDFCGPLQRMGEEVMACPQRRYQPESQDPAVAASPWADRSGA